MDKYADLTIAQLSELLSEKRGKFNELTALETPTTTQLTEAQALGTEIQEIAAAKAEAERVQASLRETAASFAASDAEAEEAEKDATEKAEAGAKEAEQETEKASEVETTETEVKVEAPAEPVAASSTVEALASKTSRPNSAAVPNRRGGPVVIKAAPDVDGFAAGQRLGNDLLDVAKAVLSRAQGFPVPHGDGSSYDPRKFPTAQFHLDFPADLTIDERDGEGRIEEVLARATDETNLPGGSLVAAGGWCAPSETQYDVGQDATRDGMISVPEVAVNRGGFRYAATPTFADFYANPGFMQTEAEAIAGTVKPCVDVDCPEFVDVRLGVEGVCIRVPILTNVGYPEYVRTFVEGTLVAHDHWINADKIGKMVTVAGAARVITGLGSTADDTLAGLELLAEQTRQKYRLSLNATLEVIVPFWTRAAMREDLARRNGLDPRNAALNDAALRSLFKERKLNVQFVYDWQGLDETAEVYPATFNALMYPAGTFVVGTKPVITLNTVYDAASLSTNVFTSLFTEQGYLVANKKFHADLVTLPICNSGRTGAADLTCVVGP